MSSIPYSVILTHKNNVFSLSDTQSHQYFCKKFLKAHQSYEKYTNNSKSKITFINENVFLYNKKDQKMQNQIDILNWIESLNQDERLSLFSINNKWLMNIFSQMLFIYFKMGNYSYKPMSEMCIFFYNQKNFSSKEEMSGSLLKFLYEKLKEKKIEFNSTTPPPVLPPLDTKKKNSEKNDETFYEYDELNLLDNYFAIKEIVDKNYIHSEKRKMEKKFIENIRIIFDENDNCDIITFTKDFIMNIENIKKFLEFFSGNNYFKDWLIPINVQNLYNFVLPSWLHLNKELSLCQIILGYFEQKIIINYEYYYYTKRLYELNFDKKISDLYIENQELEKFMYENYSFNGNDKTKEEIFTSEKIMKSVDELREDIIFNKKIKTMKDIFNKICKNNACYKGKDIIFDDELSLETYNYLNDEILKGKENNYISKLLDLITFNRFFDIINFKNYIFLNYRKKLVKLQSNSVLDELQSDGFLSQKKPGKKRKKKKKKELDDKTEEKKSQNVITKTNVINMPVYEVQTNEIECEYNMNQFNMIQENTTNVSINSKTNNNIVITESKKEEIKKPEIKTEIVVNKSSIKKEEEKTEAKNNNGNKNDINKIQENKKDNNKKSKEFFLYPTNNNSNKKNKEEKNNNINNNISESKPNKKKGKNKKHKNSNKEEKKETPQKNTIKFNYVQERKNIVQINPCPRRKKHFLLQTSSMNFAMYMNKDKINTKINNNNTHKSHWDYSQYNNNQNNSLQLFNSFVPSEKYFDSLDKELTNYLSVTNNNISSLKIIQEKSLEKIENYIQEKLSNNYEIKFGHYGSFFTGLNIEGSDLDILIYYKKKKEENDILKDILIILQEYSPNFESINPILTASVPVIKLQIDIKNEIKDLKLKQTSYIEEDDLNKIKIDLTFTENEKEFQNSYDTVNYIKNSLQDFPQIKPMLQILKRYFKIMGMNKSYTGGLCSYSLFLLVLSFCKCNKQCLSPTKLLYYFMENFTYFDYCNYCIDVKSDNCYILKDKEKVDINIEKSLSEENSSFDTNYDLYEKEEIFIIDPISNNNVSKSSFKVDDIILTFRKGFNLLYYEGWYYDCYNNNGSNNDNKIIDNMNELYEEDDGTNYMTIKKLFKLKVLRNSFDFYFN